jgi:Cdc6-like AAA superfamily ATPase
MDDLAHQLTYSSDQPIRSKREDRFNRALFAQRVADTTATRSDPSSIVIGLYGPWGGGKSSTLNLMEEALHDHSNVVVVRFNPWLYSSEDRLVQGFFDTLAAALGVALSTKAERIDHLLREYGALLLQASLPPAVAAPSPRAATRKADDSSGSVRLDELKRRAEDVLQQAGKRVVVLVDDIDRLARIEMQAIFKLVKLSAAFAHTSYVLSFDDEMVASSLGEGYAHKGYEAGRDYLSKIIQVPLHLPPADTMQLRQMVFDGVEAALRQSRVELHKHDVDAFTRYFVGGLEARLGTPRHAKLYVNAVTFALPLLEEEAHPVDLLLMEGIRIFHPKLYLVIRDNAALFLSGGRDSDQNTEGTQRRHLADLIRESVGDITPEQTGSLRRDLLEGLFPRLGQTRYPDDLEPGWAREQRVCSEQYFQRYFTYCVPPGDIGDLEVKSFLSGIVAAGASKQDGALEAFARRGAFPRLIQKLHRAVPTMKEDAASELALAIARNASLASGQHSRKSTLDSPFSQAGHLVDSLLKRITELQTRDRIAQSIAQTAEPLTFGLECLRCVSRSADHAGEDRVLSQDGDLAMRSTLVDRIQSKAAEKPLHRAFGRAARELYWLWAQRSAADVATELQRILESDPGEVDALLDAYAGDPGESTDGLPADAEISGEAYDALSRVIDPEIIAAVLVQRHGSGLGSGDFYRHDSSSVAERIGHQFLWMHQHVQRELPQQNPGPPGREGTVVSLDLSDITREST